MLKKFLIAFIFLATSHLLAWQPSGWVYKLGDYCYEYESGDWYWKSSWNFWNLNLSTYAETTSAPKGWSYYTWPYFYSSSLGQWHFAYDPGSEADVVNLNTGSWSKCGEETTTEETTTEETTTEETTTEETTTEETTVEETTVEETTTEEITTEEASNSDTTAQDTEELAPTSFAAEGLVMYVDDPEDGPSIAFIRSEDKYIQFSETLAWVDIGEYIYTKNGPNSAELIVNYVGLDLYYYNDLYSYPEKINDLTYSSNDTFTAINREDAGDVDPIVSSVSVVGPQDFAPASITGYTSTSNDYENVTTTVVFSSATSATIFDTTNDITPITYTYRKVGPREGLVEGSFASSSGVVALNFKYFFTSENSGYYYGTSEDTGYPISYSWGTFSLSDK